MSRGPMQIAVIGAGAWGTALAGLAAANRHRVVLWSRSPERARDLARTRAHPSLPGVAIDPGIAPTADPTALSDAGAIVLAVPAQALGEVLGRLAPDLPARVPAVVAAKGLELVTCRMMHEVVAAELPTAEPAILSGPSFAIDVARSRPTAVTLAAASLESAGDIARLFAGRAFRPYASDDLVGVALGGAVKNVLAIAAGIAEGRELGASARAALVARGFAELARLVEAMGGRRDTATGLSGLGDLVLTTAGPQSRNFAFGQALGTGAPPEAALARARGVVEGVASAGAVVGLARCHAIEMPICEVIDEVLSGALSIDDSLDRLLARPLRSELDPRLVGAGEFN